MFSVIETIFVLNISNESVKTTHSLILPSTLFVALEEEKKQLQRSLKTKEEENKELKNKFEGELCC